MTNGGSKVYPVGSPGNYLPATIALTAGSTTDNFSTSILTSVYKDGTSGVAYSTGVVNNTWLIAEAISGGSNATLTFQWPSSLELAGFNRGACRVARYTNPGWDVGAVDIDGRYSYSKVIKITGSPGTLSIFKIYPVPARDNITVELFSREKNKVSVIIENAAGARIMMKNEILIKGLNSVSADLKGFAAGVYLLRIIDEKGYMQVQRIIKQ